MKKLLITSLLLFAGIYSSYAQTPSLNKQQTIDYISDLYRKSFTMEAGQSVFGVSLEGKVFSVSLVSGKKFRTDLSTLNLLVVKKHEGYNSFYISSLPDDKVSILWFISPETDANRLKKALEHLIELVKAEKSTDPFDN